jgi:hypothetical protein
MNHLTDDDENPQAPAQPAEAPQPVSGHSVNANSANANPVSENTVSENTGADEGGFVQSSYPANENIAAQAAQAMQAFEDSAEESFSIAAASAASDKPDDVQGMYTAGTEAYETITHAVRASFEQVAAGFSEFNTKLMEFGRLNAQNNMAFMQSVAGVRSVRDAVDVQTAYARGQYEAAATQLRELQTLTTEIAEKASAPFKQQFARSTQLFRSC